MNNKFQTEKINQVSIKPVIVNDSLNDPEVVQGYDYFPQVYSNIFICAKKRSGKTNMIYNILKHCCLKTTRVIIFCSTVHKDATYRKILEMLDKKKVEYFTHEGFVDDDTGDNLLASLLDDLKKPDDDEPIDERKLVKPSLIDFGEYQEEKKRQREIKKDKKKKKKIAPEIIVVCDDLGTMCRSKYLTQLTKINRHVKAKILISSQNIHDLEPAAIKQLDVCMVSKSLNPTKIKKIYEDLDIGNIDLEKFTDVYKFATEKPYSFLYIDVRNESYRINFDTEIKI